MFSYNTVGILRKRALGKEPFEEGALENQGILWTKGP